MTRELLTALSRDAPSMDKQWPDPAMCVLHGRLSTTEITTMLCWDSSEQCSRLRVSASTVRASRMCGAKRASVYPLRVKWTSRV